MVDYFVLPVLVKQTIVAGDACPPSLVYRGRVGGRAEDACAIAGDLPYGSCGLSGSQHPDQLSCVITRRMSTLRSWSPAFPLSYCPQDVMGGKAPYTSFTRPVAALRSIKRC